MHSRSGFTLIEVLVCFILLSLILLALDAIQLSSLQAAQSTYYESVARNQIHHLADELKIPSQQKNISLLNAQWQAQNKSLLPESISEITLAPPKVSLFISWGGSKSESCHSGRRKCIKEEYILED